MAGIRDRDGKIALVDNQGAERFLVDDAGIITSSPEANGGAPTLLDLLIQGTTLSDDFERSGTFLGSDSPSGHTWANVTGSGTFSIASGRLTVNTAGNAYAQMGLDSTPTEIGGKVSWVTGGGTDAQPAGATLISSSKDYLITDAVHFNCVQTGYVLQIVVASSFITIDSGSYTIPLDGAPRTISLAISGNTATYVTPDGVTHTITDSRISQKAGKYIIYELGNPVNAPLVRWDSVYAKEAIPVGNLLATLVGGGALASRRFRSTLRAYKILFDRGAENGLTDTLTSLYVSALNNLKTDGIFRSALGLVAEAGNFGVTVGGCTIFSGTGSPEGVTTAPVGSLFLRTNGGAGTTLYVKESGAGNTGWIAK